jgi:hypothetical protein
MTHAQAMNVKQSVAACKQQKRTFKQKKKSKRMRAETKTNRERCWGGMGVNAVSCRQAWSCVEQTNSERGEGRGVGCLASAMLWTTRPSRTFPQNAQVATTVHRSMRQTEGNRKDNNVCLLRPSNVCFTAVKLTPPALAGLTVQNVESFSLLATEMRSA